MRPYDVPSYQIEAEGPDPLLTIDEVAFIVKRHPKTIRRQLKQGTFPESSHQGDRSAPMWRHSAVLKWLREHQDGPLLTIDEVGVIVDRHPRTIRRQIKRGTFPRGRYLFNSRIPMWKRSDIRKWIRDQERLNREPGEEERP